MDTENGLDELIKLPDKIAGRPYLSDLIWEHLESLGYNNVTYLSHIIPPQRSWKWRAKGVADGRFAFAIVAINDEKLRARITPNNICGNYSNIAESYEVNFNDPDSFKQLEAILKKLQKLHYNNLDVVDRIVAWIERALHKIGIRF